MTGDNSKQECCGHCHCEGSNLDHKQLLNLTDDDVAALKNADAKIVIGKVLKIEDHPDEKMTKVKVTTTQTDAEGATETILCGGTNLEVGDVAAVATVGTMLGEDFEIGVRDLRGVESHGMICARSELGLSLQGEVKGEIWRIPAAYEEFLGKSLKDLVS